MASKKVEEGWAKAESLIKEEKAEEALELLREIDVDASESKTWRLAGDAKVQLAHQSGNNKRLFKEAVMHYENALKSNPNDKTARRSLNSLRSEMDGLGIRAGGMNVFFDDGAPTFAGIVSIVVAIGLVLVGLKVIPEWLDPAQEYDYKATMTISYTPNGGTLTTVQVIIDLDPQAAPIHVDNFVKLSKRGEYENIIFHRIIDDFMIQGGDFENQDGTGGYAAEFYGYCDGTASTNECDSETKFTVPDEANNGLVHNSCTISMAKTSAANTGGSQFFLIPEDSTPSHLDGQHTVFGEITYGCDDVTSMSQVATDSGDKPYSAVTLLSVDIETIPL